MAGDWKGQQWEEDCIKYHGKVLTGALNGTFYQSMKLHLK